MRTARKLDHRESTLIFYESGDADVYSPQKSLKTSELQSIQTAMIVGSQLVAKTGSYTSM
jgi:hypothetical protein